LGKVHKEDKRKWILPQSYAGTWWAGVCEGRMWVELLLLRI